MSNIYETSPGEPHPLGAIADNDGVNFSVFSEHATSVELLIFNDNNSVEPTQTIKLDRKRNRTFCFWHVYVRGAKPGMCYAYRVDGSQDVYGGHRFNKNKVLIDPYAKGNTINLWNRGDACNDKDNASTAMRSIIVKGLKDYDWEGDKPLKIPMKDTVIYEMHIGGFTRSKTSGVENPGTFKAAIEKVPYLKELGINAVELLPVFDYDDANVLRKNQKGEELKLYWGYDTIGFFAPNNGYCVSPEEGQHMNEFRDMVKAMHKAGIQVILDVVFNHTDEGNENGPIISFKGFDNKVYYILPPDAKNYYMNYSGCGNTLNCNHPIVIKFIVECLEFWVKEAHIDGFRFDEGSILSRSDDGSILKYPPILWNLEISEEFADTKLIAEVWDAGGLNLMGKFPGYKCGEWNGKYRDDIRHFIKGDNGYMGAAATHIAGSSDIYHSSTSTDKSINFITCHDGFTMMDLVSYNGKHNEDNGENNRDGVDDNVSWNCGVEGDTGDPAVVGLRKRQIKNFASVLFLSRGVPMFLYGDEVGRTQKGNNNAYCQNNDISWFDWSLTGKNKDLLNFFTKIIAFRKRNSVLHNGYFYSGETNERNIKDIDWYDRNLNIPDWNNAAEKSFAFIIGGFEKDEPDIYVMLNMHWQPIEFKIPEVQGRGWFRFADTSLPSPDDIAQEGKESPVGNAAYRVQDRSIVILISK